MELNPGQVYKRTALHDYFGGQQQGGISTPAKHPVVLLFTGEVGEQYGYSDGFQEDGLFWYTGEGQIGDMGFVRGNKAILEADAKGKTIHLFEYGQKAHVKYVGKLAYVGYHYALAPDISGQDRQIIVFELALVNSQETEETTVEIEEPFKTGGLWQMSISDVRGVALSNPPAGATIQQKRANSYKRSEAVKVYVLRRAGDACEGCGKTAPFKNRQGRPYLEPHHINRLADGGPDHPAYVAALCPDCHRRVHYGYDGEGYNRKIAGLIKKRERIHD